MRGIVSRVRNTLAAAAAVAAAAAAPGAQALSTDGYHTIQIIPIAVQTGSFSTSFFFHNPSGSALPVSVTYYPATATSTAGPVFCGNKNLAASRVTSYTSLTALCPGITAGSNFGWLWVYEIDPENRPFAVFTRVDNPQAQGFEIESYPVHTFTAATSFVTGLRRTSTLPGTGTNCFIAALQEATVLDVSLWNGGTGAQIGSTQTYNLAARQMLRLTDIFASVGAPAGNYTNAYARFFESAAGEPGAIAFCTVQNNTTFDADFRIAKAYTVQDDHVLRSLTQSTDALSNAFTLGTYPNERNRHVVYLKHPDWVKCSIARTNGLLSDLEMRLVAPDGTTVVAGGNDATSFAEVYLGDKSTRGSGANDRWFIDVEGGVAGSTGATYSITCTSGSGHTNYELVGRNLPSVF